MMNQTMKIVKVSEIRRLGPEALMKALGSVGRARYFEGYDKGGLGDYTKEKYEEPDYSIDEILSMKKN